MRRVPAPIIVLLAGALGIVWACSDDDPASMDAGVRLSGATIGSTTFRAENIAATGTITQAGSQVFSQAGSGLLAGGPIVAADTTYLQRRVTGTCGGGSAVTTVNADGTVACNAVGGGGSVSITSAGGLTMTPSPITGTGTIAVNIPTTSCAAGSGVTAIAATGAGTCTADVISVTGSAPIAASTVAGASTVSLTGCTSGQGYVDLSGTWTCQNYLSSVGTGLSLTGDTINLNMAGASCAGGSFMSALTATGAGTCTAGHAGTVTSVTCSTGLNCTAANPIVAAGTITLADTAVTPASYTYASLTVDQQGRLTAASNGTTPDTGAGTANTIAKYTAANTLGNSSITDDGTTTTFGATSTTIVDASGNTNIAGTLGATGNVLFAARMLTFNGNAFMANGNVGFQFNTNATASGFINSTGFSNGTTQFRDLHIQDGKGADAVVITGSTKFFEMFGAGRFDSITETTGVATFDAGQTTVGHIGATGTAPAVSACGAAPSILAGSTDVAGQITFGAATTTSCTYTFNQTWASAPFCVCSNAGTVSSEALTSCSASTTTLTIAAVSGTTAGIFTYHCTGKSATIP